jgi:Ca2+-binding EF-hand superfamily protein
MLRALTLAALAIALDVAALPTPVLAAAAETFDALDKDRDGKVSVSEASGHDGLFVAFKSLDKDRDGMLTREEFAAFQKEKPAA